MRGIQEQLVDYSTKYLSTVLPVLEELKPVNYTDKQKTLTKLGFINSSEFNNINELISNNKKIETRNEKRIEELRRFRNWVTIYMKGRNFFGSNTLLIRFLDFYKIIKRNNLVCGPFNNYLGEIPDENLREIQTLANFIEKDQKLINRLNSIKSIEFDGLGVPNILYRFPFVIKNGFIWEDIIGTEMGCLNHELEYKITGTDYEDFWYFICAPAHQMISKKRLFVLQQRSKDPFICSYSRCVNSVFIHSRWGEEAKLKTIRKYEELNERLNERVETLGWKI